MTRTVLLLTILDTIIFSRGNTQRIVDTEYGQVRGHEVNVNNGVLQTKIEVFHGIPFGKDTSGARRFKKPEVPDPWDDILEADRVGSGCPQVYPLTGFDVGEDCLHANIYVPTEGDGPYPVMIWIHGGGYQTEANFWYPGHFLSTFGVIVATINYRLGKFGFSYTGNSASPGNVGLWDQKMGIEFVINNIANFGGDTTRITLFGESAGGSSTSLHMVSPQTNGLFNQAIMESGTEINFWSVNPPDSHPEDYTLQMAQQLDCEREDDNDMMECLRQLSWENLIFNTTITCTPGYICVGMAPVVDGPGGFLPELPIELRESGDVMSGPILAGINKEDGATFLPAVAPGVVVDDCCNRTYFDYILKDVFTQYFSTRISNETMENVYHALDYMYTPWPYLYDTDANRHGLVKLTTDASFGVSWDYQIKDHCQFAPTYGYLYDYMSNNSRREEWQGTPHAVELDSVWGFPMLQFNPEVRNDSGLVGGLFTQLDVEYSLFVMELWTNFAKYGNPTPNPVPTPFGDTYTWPLFTLEDMNLVYFGKESTHTIKEWLQKEYAFWTEYLRWMTAEDMGWDELPSMLPIQSEDLVRQWMDGFSHVLQDGDDFNEI